MLEVRHLSKHFGGIRAVDDCSFTVARGSITALIGPNGAGKTTAFNCISKTMTPTAGASFLVEQRGLHSMRRSTSGSTATARSRSGSARRARAPSDSSTRTSKGTVAPVRSLARCSTSTAHHRTSGTSAGRTLS